MRSQAPYDQVYPFPQVAVVDRGGGQTYHGTVHPGMIPTWSFPPAAQEMARRRGKHGGCMGVSSRLSLVVLLLFALVFASLGMGAVWTVNLQKELKEVKKMVKAVNKSAEEKVRTDAIIAPQKQIGLYEPKMKGQGEVKNDRPAAHLMVSIPARERTLKWMTDVGRAFTAGGVAYKVEDGALQVNETGLYYVYCRVELIFRKCTATSSFEHSVFVRRQSLDLTLMVAHRQGFCPEGQSRAWTTESYLGAALHLQKADRLFVNLSQPHNLNTAHYANFFGLYLI